MKNFTSFVEKKCIVERQGKKYFSNGAVVTEDNLIAYPGENGVLNDWHRNQIGIYGIISSRPAIFFGCKSCFGDKYYYMRAKVNNKFYSIRGFGIGMIATGKRIKK